MVKRTEDADKATKKHKKGRCCECINAQPLGDYSMMCKIYKAGKAKNSLRICEHYEPK